MAESGQQDAGSRPKTPKQQLSRGMEHLRFAVTVPDPKTPAATLAIESPDNTTTASEATESEEPAYGVPPSYQPLRHPTTDSALNHQKRTDPFQFGSRFLEEGDDIFAHNAWDHVVPDPSYDAFITTQTEFQSSNPVSDFDKQRFNTAPQKWWDKFYSNNRGNFFKDRKWLVQEFPVLSEITKEGYGDVRVVEVGAGAGNTAFPIKEMNRNEGLRIHACDYSKKAIEVIRESEAYDGSVLRADVWDAAGTGEEALPRGVKKGTVDIVIMIFIFSALEPRQWRQCVRNVWDMLKPGGIVLFRDYGRGDLAQVRFKKGRYLEENFYVRGDGTRVYFFEKEELVQIWSGQNAEMDHTGNAEDDLASRMQETGLEIRTNTGDGSPAFEVVNLAVDRRMLVNRQRKLKMYRCWMQGLFKKPATSDAAG